MYIMYMYIYTKQVQLLKEIRLKLQVCSLFCSLFQAHSAFRCIVMGANAKRCSRMQKEILARKVVP